MFHKLLDALHNSPDPLPIMRESQKRDETWRKILRDNARRRTDALRPKRSL